MLSTQNPDFIGKKGYFQYIVDNIMLSNYHTLACVASSLQTILPGHRISELYTQQSNELIIAFEGEFPSLVFLADRTLASVYLHPGCARARSNSADVLSGAQGSSVASVRIHPCDRVLVLSLASGNRIVLQLFGARSNALLVNPAGIVLDAFLHKRELTGQMLDLRREDELIYDFARFRVACGQTPDAGAGEILRRTFPSLGSTLVDEILFRSPCAGDCAASSLDADAFRRLESGFLTVLREIATPRPSVYCDHRGIPVVFSIIPLEHRAVLPLRSFDDCHETIRFFVTRQRAGEKFHRLFDEIHAPLQRALTRLLRTRSAMQEEAREAHRADQYERWGNIILSQLSSIARGDRLLQSAGESIPLLPQLTPAGNAQHYFQKGKRARAAAADKEVRLADLDRRISAGQALQNALEQAGSPADLSSIRTSHADALALFALTQEAQARAELPFRIFRVDGGFEVWAGKSSDSNDLLTLRHAKPDDLWFHARGSSGSHVLLRVASAPGEPSKRAKEQAAAIAAYFSKMKTASLVPVAMTEKRYVRKPRGAPAGTVVLEREKVVFVEPELPPEKPLPH